MQAHILIDHQGQRHTGRVEIGDVPPAALERQAIIHQRRVQVRPVVEGAAVEIAIQRVVAVAITGIAEVEQGADASVSVRGSEIGVGPVNAGINDTDDDAFAAQSLAVDEGGARVGHAQVVERSEEVIRLDIAHARRLGQRRQLGDGERNGGYITESGLHTPAWRQPVGWLGARVGQDEDGEGVG